MKRAIAIPAFSLIIFFLPGMIRKIAWAILLLCLACSPKNSGIRPEGADAKTATLPEWFSEFPPWFRGG